MALELSNLNVRKKKTKIQTAAGGDFNELGTLNSTLHLDSGRLSARRGFSNSVTYNHFS